MIPVAILAIVVEFFIWIITGKNYIGNTMNKLMNFVYSDSWTIDEV